MNKLLEDLERLWKNNPSASGLIKEVAISLGVISLVFLALYAYSGTWPPVVSVSGNSMYPDMHAGDLVLLQSIGRGNIIASDEAKATGYTMYNGYGDVIVYRPMGDSRMPLVIHRAMHWVNKSEPMWPDGPLAPESGYITLGDNNDGFYDQATDICPGQPVREEWILGTAKFSVPYLGYLRSLIPF